MEFSVQMTPEEEKKITEWNRKLSNEIHIELSVSEDSRSNVFSIFCDDLMRLAPKILITIEKEDQPAPPVIKIGNVTYRAIPSEKELEPFLNLLFDIENDVGRLPTYIQNQLEKIELPAPLKIYITPFCPFCPAVVKQLLSLAAANEFIKLTVIDGALFPEMAKSDHIQSAPTVLLDDQYRWTGSIQIEEIVNMILNRDPAGLSAVSLEDMLTQGDAVRIADMMLNSAKIFPAFLELLVHEKWSVRLGAMVAFETVAAKDSPLALQAVPFLWERFQQEQDMIKGDILYLLGISGSKQDIPKIEKVINGPYHSEVKEAALDALIELHHK